MPDTDALPTVASLAQWAVGREKRGLSVTFLLTDPVEARAWSSWLLDREAERDQALALLPRARRARACSPDVRS
jgi:hypothetical protein